VAPMNIVTSKDGTGIAFERSGSGAPVVLVSGALGTRQSEAEVAALLASDFTVYTYDRRGRGDSGDAAQYDVSREVEDLAAVITEAGGPVSVYGTSSGGNLVLEAASRGLNIARVALWEPNFLVDDSRPPLPKDYVQRLTEFVVAGRRGDAVEYFFTVAVGLPSEFVTPMRQMPMWQGMEAVAHTLAYDGEIVGGSMAGNPPSAERWAAVAIPALVIDGGQTRWLTAGAQAIAEVLPQARSHTISGQQHNVSAEAIVPVLRDFFARPGAGQDAAGSQGEAR
jgi:pimeloyl-ACP methyl ester carboxylesterase